VAYGLPPLPAARPLLSLLALAVVTALLPAPGAGAAGSSASSRAGGAGAAAGARGPAGRASGLVAARVAGGRRARLPAAAVVTDRAAAAPGVAVAGQAGRWLVDPLGRVVVLRGLNMVAKRPPFLPSRMGFGPDDATWLRAQGFTTVRLGVIASGVQPAPGAFDDAYLDDIAATVRQLHAAGLTTLVDLHQDYYTESTGGEGFPGWLTHDIGALPQLGLARADAGPFDGLWANRGGVQDSIADLWERVARRLRGEPGIIGYDLFNEPYPGTRVDECAVAAGCPAFDTGVLLPFYKRLTAGVRAADPDRLVFVEPGVNFNQGAATWIGATGDARTAFSFHAYCSPVVGRDACSARQPQVFANAEHQATAARQASLLTEFGATDDLGRLRSVLDDADRAMVGWIEWSYFNEDPCCARPHEGLVRTLAQPPTATTVKADKLAVLARPGPVLIAGTPLSWRWNDAAGRLEVRWSTARATGRRATVGAGGARAAGAGAGTADGARATGGARATARTRAAAPRRPKRPSYVDERRVSVLEVPVASVPVAWQVQVTGGRVLSAPGERTVRILADPGVATVTAVVQRG
jgi:endoglycosylceramidase